MVLKSPDATKFKLANAFFPGAPVRPCCGEKQEQERARSGSSTSKNNAAAQAELAAVEPASTTPSPAPAEGVVSVPSLVLLKGKGAQFGIPGTTTKFPSHVHSTPPGLVEAGWDSEGSAEA